MRARRRRSARQHPLGDPRPGTNHEYRWKHGARWIEHGDAVKLRGRRGTFKAIRRVYRSGSQWVDVFDSAGAWRSVRPDEVRLAPKRRAKR